MPAHSINGKDGIHGTELWLLKVQRAKPLKTDHKFTLQLYEAHVAEMSHRTPKSLQTHTVAERPWPAPAARWLHVQTAGSAHAGVQIPLPPAEVAVCSHRACVPHLKHLGPRVDSI